MKIVAIIARYLLGLLFLVSGLNHYLNFIPAAPLPPGPVADFTNVMTTTHYIWVTAFFQVVPSILLLVNRYVPLALTLLGPVIFNILVINILMVPKALPVIGFLTVLWLLVFWRHRASFAGIFVAKTEG
jgi:putative oxidoreductase